MTEKFTQGEWHSGIDAEDKRPYIFCGDSPQEIIADVFVPNQSIEQAKANAALIAAAPDMYALLKIMASPTFRGATISHNLGKAIEATLKKARGQE